MCIFNRSATLSDGSSNQNNKTATNRYRLTLSSRAGFPYPIQKVYSPIQSSSSSPSPVPSFNSPQFSSSSNIHTISPYTETIPSTVTTKTTTVPTSTITSSTTSTPPPSPLPTVQIVDKFKSFKNDPLPDHYYYAEQDGDYYDNVDEINIPSTEKSLNKSSINSLSQSSEPIKSFIFPNVESELRFKLPALTEPRYDQSTLKSFFMNSMMPSTTTEGISLANLKKLFSEITTEKTTSTTSNARDLEVQRQRILSFIISENQPSSFKAPSTTTTSTTTTEKSITNHNYNNPSSSSNKFNHNNNINFNAFVNMQKSHESTTTVPSISSTTVTTPTDTSPKTTKLLSSVADNKPIRLTLSTSNLDSYNKKPTRLIKEKDDEIPVNYRARQTTTEKQKILYLKPIEPTTYKPIRISTEASRKSEISTINTIDNYSNSDESDDDNDDIIDPESLLTHSRRRPYVNDFLSSTRFPPRTTEIIPTKSTTLTTPRTIAQSFTSRGLIFKEILNKTLEPQVNLKSIVSPYLSLEAQRLTNAIRTTTPRTTNLVISRVTSTTASPSTSSPIYRNFFFITAPPKSVANISTYLFPETTTLSPPITTTSPPPLILNNVESSTENTRGKYRPFSISSSLPNSIDEEAPTTYSPRLRYNTRTHVMADTQMSSEQPSSVRRKVIRLKSALTPPSTEKNIDVTTYTPARRIFIDNNFIPSPVSDTNDFRPIITKLNEFISKLDLFNPSVTPTSSTSSTMSSSTTSKGSSYDDEITRPATVVEVTEKQPFYYTRYNFNNNINRFNNNNNLRNITTSESLASNNYNNSIVETSTKKFRATVEMPEMKVPSENFESDSSNYDEEENENDEFIDEHDIVLLSSTTPTTQSPSSMTVTLPVTTKTTTIPLTTMTTLRSTENLLLSTSTTVNPKSFIPPRATRVNNAIKSSIIASGLPRRNSNSASIKCNDVSSNAKCNEIPSRY